MNPEFRRNLILELSMQKLIIAPLIIFSIFYLAYLTSTNMLKYIPETIFVLVTIVYGSYMAGDTITDEVQAHTWPLQRLTTLSPWSMAWGKLFGGTIYVWYCALWCILFIFLRLLIPVDILERNLFYFPVQTSLYLIAMAIIFQSFSIMLNLLRLEKAKSQLKRAIIVPLIAIFSWPELGISNKSITWYWHTYNDMNFSVFFALVFAAWFICSIYMLMRRELQCKNTPWPWLLFLAFFIFFVLGFTFHEGFKFELEGFKVKEMLHSSRVLVAYVILASFTFILALIERIDVISISYQFRNSKSFHKLFNMSPRWVHTLILSITCGLYLAATIPDVTFPHFNAHTFIFALMIFLCRDVAILAYLDLKKTKRYIITPLIYFFVLYAVLPGIFELLHIDQLTTFFIPRPDYAMGYLMIPLVQAIAAWFYVYTYWQKLIRH